jgi:hypothetical protein
MAVVSFISCTTAPLRLHRNAAPVLFLLQLLQSAPS